VIVIELRVCITYPENYISREFGRIANGLVEFVSYLDSAVSLLWLLCTAASCLCVQK
jgi:hypothetical protein